MFTVERKNSGSCSCDPEFRFGITSNSSNSHGYQRSGRKIPSGLIGCAQITGQIVDPQSARSCNIKRIVENLRIPEIGRSGKGIDQRRTGSRNRMNFEWNRRMRGVSPGFLDRPSGSTDPNQRQTHHEYYGCWTLPSVALLARPTPSAHRIPTTRPALSHVGARAVPLRAYMSVGVVIGQNLFVTEPLLTHNGSAILTQTDSMTAPYPSKINRLPEVRTS